MKVKHKNSGEIVNLSEPNYGKHYASMYGFLVLSGSQIWFFYIIDDELHTENLTNEYEILNPNDNPDGFNMPCGDCSTKTSPCRSINCQYSKVHKT
jgi:hypothetical protein